jgi:hypothetical protein
VCLLVSVATDLLKYNYVYKGKGNPVTGPEGPIGWVEVLLNSFLTSALEGGVWSASRPGRLYPRERPGVRCTGGLVGPGAGLDRCGKSRPETRYMLILNSYFILFWWTTHPCNPFCDTLNLISNLYLVFIRFSARYRTISSANETESILEKIELNSHYSVTTNWNQEKTKHCSLPTIPATISSFIFFLGKISRFTTVREFTVLTLLSRAHLTRGEKSTTPDTAFVHCCYPTGKHQSNLLNK